MKSKYKNNKHFYNGITFDSAMELDYYKYLKSLSTVSNIVLQPKFTLLPSFIYKGIKRREITYTLDFLVTYNDGTQEFIDVKGMSTQQGDLKRKMFEYVYNDKTLIWVTKSIKHGVNGWIDYDKLKKIRAANNKKI